MVPLAFSKKTDFRLIEQNLITCFIFPETLRTLSGLVVIALGVLSTLIIGFSTSHNALSVQYEKQPRSFEVTSGIHDVKGLSGIYMNFNVPSDATDARLS